MNRETKGRVLKKGGELRQAESPHEEDSHLVTGDGRGGTVSAGSAAAGGVLYVQ